MPRRGAYRTVPFESVKPVVEGIVNLPLDQPAAHPQSAGTIIEGAGIDAARDLLGLEALFPRRARIRNDQFVSHNQPVHLQFFSMLPVCFLKGGDTLFQRFYFLFEDGEVVLRKERPGKDQAGQDEKDAWL